MMDKRPRKELLAGIRDSLRNFEEPYDRKEWEHFQRQRKNKQWRPIPLFVKLAGIAASLFLMVYASVRFLPFFDGVDEEGKHVPKEEPHPLKEKKQEVPDTLTVDTILQAVDQNTTAYQRAPEGLTSPPRLANLLPEEETGIRTVRAPTAGTESMADSMAIERPLKMVPLESPPHREPQRSIGVDFPMLRPSLGSGIGVRDIKAGFNLTPAFTNKGFSLGGGVSAQIPISSRISTEIGVSYMNLRVGMNTEADRTDTVSLQTVGIRNSVGMVALPVSLNYVFTENFSASIGLVPFWVVRDQRTDIRQSYRWVNDDLLSGDTTRRFVGERTQSQRADSLYMGNTYLGFIHVSGQFSPPFLKKRNVVVSPFIAVPVGRLRDDEYHWLHGGVSIRVYLRNTKKQLSTRKTTF